MAIAFNSCAEPQPEVRRFPLAIVNVTNRCNLECQHCFVYREGNPNEARDEPSADELLIQIRRLRDRHGIASMLWMGGEPLIQKGLLRRGLPLFARNTITTNGTIPLEDFSDVTSQLLYVVSLDGPRNINDSIRGKGVYDRVLSNVGQLPGDFPHVVQCQCVVTRKNEASLETFVAGLRDSGFDHLTFSFYVPSCDDRTGNAWETLEERDHAIRFVMELKERHGGFIRNRRRSLELLLSKNNPQRVTNDCPAKRFVLPLYLEGRHLVSPFCCYGNDVDCDRCGAWVVFELAALEERQGIQASNR